jgi:5-methylcytosine-specific restriction endonuclease McrA
MRLTDIAWVEVDSAGNPLTIFKNHKQAIIASVTIVQMVYGVAAEKIRHAVFSRDNFTCTHCGACISLNGDGAQRGHMHERQWRGKGGLISMENSTTLCYDCHINSDAGHGMRRPQWSKNVQF